MHVHIVVLHSAHLHVALEHNTDPLSNPAINYNVPIQNKLTKTNLFSTKFFEKVI